MDDAETLLTPAQVSQTLGVSASTPRRHALMYEELFGPLPRERDQRRWPASAVRRLQTAPQALAGGQVGSLEITLTPVRDGQALPEPAQMPEDLAPIPDMTLPPNVYLELVVEKLRGLRTLIEAQHAERTALRGEVQALRALPAVAVPGGSTPALQESDSPSPRALLEAVSALRQEVWAQGEREGERYRMLIHAVAHRRKYPGAGPGGNASLACRAAC